MGAAGLLLVLGAAGGLSVLLLGRANQAIEATFKYNGDSVAYMHELTDALDGINRLLEPGDDPVSRVERLGSLRATIQRCVAGEFQCVSENGEGHAAQALQASWGRYQAHLDALGRIGGAQGRRRYFVEVLGPDQKALRALAWEIAGMNLRNARFRDHGRMLLLAEERWTTALLLVGAALATALVAALGRWILVPLLELTKGVRAVERGRLDLAVPVRSGDEMGELAAAFNDMAERLREHDRGFRARLLRSQRTTQLAINSFSDPVAVLGNGGLVEICNRSAERLFGLKAGSSLEGSPLAGLRQHLAQVLAGRAYEPQGYGEALRVSVSGRDKYILPRMLPVENQAGLVVGVTLVLADVTGLRKMDEMKSGLLATVSHELKNPLTSLRMGTHLLLEDALGPRTPKQEALLLSLRDNSERLHSILEELLDLGRMESGDLLSLESRPADALIREALDRARKDLTDRGLALGTEIVPGLPSVAADPRRLSHVFSNLLDNAMKHSPPGGTVWVGASREGRASVRFWVQDEGSGVPEAFRSRIFERFFRVPGQALGHGMGLGLAIAKEVAELHGGTLRLEDTVQGARFVLILPADSNS